MCDESEMHETGVLFVICIYCGMNLTRACSDTLIHLDHITYKKAFFHIYLVRIT